MLNKTNIIHLFSVLGIVFTFNSFAFSVTPSIIINLVGGGELSGDVSFNFIISDAENIAVDLKVEYNIGGDWVTATTTGDISALLPPAYSGTFSWISLTDADGIDSPNTLIRVTPSDSNGTGAPGVSSFFLLDNNLTPKLTIETPSGESSGDVIITYALSDPEGDDLNIIGEYNVDGTWQFALSIPNITSANYSGELTWSSLNDIPGIDETNTFFQIIVSDNDIGDAAATNAFHLDNNDIPSIFISGPVSEFRGDAIISYNISDNEDDTYGIRVEYSTNNGSSWSLADVTGDTSGLTLKSGNITWNSLRDIPRFVGGALLRLIPHDNDAGNPGSVSLLMDNIGAPAVFINTGFPSELQGDFIFQYQIIDEESDSVFLDVEFRRNPNSPWIDADITGQLDELFPGGYSGTLTWHSDSIGQLSHEDRLHAGFRIMARDKNPGGWFEWPDVHVDNNEIPEVISVSSIPNTITGKITIPMEIADVEGDTLSIDVQISRDGGITWKFGSSNGESSGLLPTNYTPDFIWDSVIDLGFHLAADVRLRLAARDNDRSPFIETNDFIVHNKVGDFSGDLRIDFDDIAGFQNSWLAQDTIRETGPTTGTVPNLVVQRDGVVDFEDLLPFIQMWNWSLEANGGSSSKPITEFSGSNGSPALLIESRENEDSSIDVYIAIPETENVWSGRIQFFYDSKIKIADLSLTDSYADNRQSIYIERIENSIGTAEVVIAPIDGYSLSDWRDQLIKLNIQSNASGYSGKLTVAYDFRGKDGEKIESAVQEFEFEIRSNIPKEYQLLNNYPNPFNPSTTIEFDLSVQGDIRLTIYNLLGEVVKTFADQALEPGRHTIVWKGDSNSGVAVSSGIYFYSLRTGNFHSVKKMLLVR